MHQSILIYRGFRYLKWAALVTLASMLAYAFHTPMGLPNGGTWLGYTLGSIGLVLILWLTWFGVRKRRYGASSVKLEDWLSAHVYLGLALVVVATLHTGFQFGWNVHTLAYALMIGVVASGVFGVYAYMRYPRLMTQNRGELTLDKMMLLMSEIDREARAVAMPLGDDVNRIVLAAAQDTCVGGSTFRQLSGRDPNCPTQHALDWIKSHAGQVGADHAVEARKLLTLLQRKAELVGRARRDVQIKAMLDIWLYVHVPMAIALLAALIAHVVAVFFYW
ncbi:MAG: hypothetical protein FJX52_03290 [Alphaproteobacteria bacterium]|nr:hypothetical protein [Alphaproteobacteria bacterium]